MRSSTGRNMTTPGSSLGHVHQPRHVVGHLHPGEPLGAALRVAHGDREVEREPRDVGERVRRVDRERGEHREDLVEEVLRQPAALVVGQVPPAQDPDACSASSSGRTWSRNTLACASAMARLRVGDAGQLLARGQPVGAADGEAGLVAPLQPGDPDHVELVEVGGEDRQELRPLQQRLAGVLGQRQHAGVEVEPGQLTVEVAVVGQLGGGRGGARGRATGTAAVDGLRHSSDPRRHRGRPLVTVRAPSAGGRWPCGRAARGGWPWRRCTRRVAGRGARRFAERAPCRLGSCGPGSVPGVRLASSPTGVILSHPDVAVAACAGYNRVKSHS